MAEDQSGRERLPSGRTYILNVTARIEETEAAHHDVARFCVEQGLHDSIEDHVQAIFAASGVADLNGRVQQVQAAIRRQQQLLQERKNRKKERLKDAVAKATTGGESRTGEEGAAGGERQASAERAKDGPEAPGRAPATTGQESTERWHEVQAFRTHEEALTFVMACQPFGYRPAGPDGDALPKFDSVRDEVQFLLSLNPVPQEFVSAEKEFRRRMRVRKVITETREELALRLMSRRQKLLIGRNRGSDQPVLLHKPEDPKPWVVEAAGSLFERPPSLRSLRDKAPRRYYVAVAPDIERKVLTEGFKVKRRCSIPCSATPQEALAAFSRNEQRCGRPASLRAAVLGVNIPGELEVDVLAHRSGGFLIRTTELPASCFSRVKRLAPGDS